MLRPDEPVHALTPTRPIARLAALLRHRLDGGGAE